MRFASVSRSVAVLTLAGLGLTMNGCETMDGLAGDFGGLVELVAGSDASFSDMDFFAALREDTDDARSEVRSAFDELEAMKQTPPDEIDQQYAKYDAAAADLKAQSASLDARIDAAERQAEQYLDEAVREIREENAGAGALAEQFRKNNSKEFSAIFNQARSAQNQLMPLINQMDAAANQLRATAKAQSGDTANLQPIEQRVDAVIGDLDDTVDAIDEGELSS